MSYRPPEPAPLIATREVQTCLGDPGAGFDVVARGVDFEYATCRNEFELRRARAADVVYVFPQPAAQSLATIYPPNYGPFQFQQLRGPARWGRDLIQERKAKEILKLAGPEGRVLDLGCGAGVLLQQMARLRKSTHNLVANDFAEEIVAPLRAAGFETLVGRAERLRTNDPLRVITLLQVLEHLSEPVAAVRNLATLLEPGGYLLIETPSIDGWDARWFRKRYWGGYHIPRHFYLFNASSLRRLMQEAGLEVVAVKYLASPAFWIQSCHHAALDHGFPRLAKLFTIKNPLLLAAAVAIDTLAMVLSRPTSNIRIVARRPR